MRVDCDLLLVAACALPLAAQAHAPSEPPPLVQILRGPGAAALHPYARLAVQTEPALPNVLALRAITSTPESWFVELHDSFASVERLDSALAKLDETEGGDAAAARVQLAIYVPLWSNRPAEAVALLSRARYYSVIVCEAGTGLDKDFAETMSRPPAESWSQNRPALGYRVISGAGPVRSIVFVPLLSLAEFDEGLPHRLRGGTTISAREMITTEQLLLRVQPERSIVDADFASVEPDLWRAARKR
jgi:hypothetical protein